MLVKVERMGFHLQSRCTWSVYPNNVSATVADVFHRRLPQGVRIDLQDCDVERTNGIGKATSPCPALIVTDLPKTYDQFPLGRFLGRFLVLHKSYTKNQRHLAAPRREPCSGPNTASLWHTLFEPCAHSNSCGLSCCAEAFMRVRNRHPRCSRPHLCTRKVNSRPS